MSKEIKSEYKPKVVISTDLAAQINFMHSQCPLNREWSALLIYKVEKGGIDDLANLEIRAEGLFPMDFGDATFTSFEGDHSWLECFRIYPQVDPMKPEPGWYIGKLHDHPNFSVFHSGTDKNDLYETAPKFPMFLSLIVNYATETDCELAIAVEMEEELTSKTKYKLKGWKEAKEKEEKTSKNEKLTYVMKCEVFYEQEQWMIDQCKYLSTKSKPVPNNIRTLVDKDKKKEATKDDTVVIVRKHIRDKTLDNLADLVSLGESEGVPLRTLLGSVNDAIEVNQRETYKKALKVYFLDYWYHSHFYSVNVDEKEVLNAILDLMKLQEGWIVVVIKETINELKTECTELWEV